MLGSIYVEFPGFSKDLPYRVEGQVDHPSSHAVPLMEMELQHNADPDSTFSRMTPEQMDSVLKAARIIANIVRDMGGSAEDAVRSAERVVTAADPQDYREKHGI